MEDYQDHASILVADVDCIGAGKSKCDDVGIKGFPTIKPLGRLATWSITTVAAARGMEIHTTWRSTKAEGTWKP